MPLLLSILSVVLCFCHAPSRAKSCVDPDTRAVKMNPQFCPLFPAIPPPHVYGHFPAPNNPHFLLMYVLATHDVELDYEKMARFSRQQLDARLWMSSTDQVAAGMQFYVNYAQGLRQCFDSGVQKKAHEVLQRQGYVASNLPIPPPIIESSPENAPPLGNHSRAALGSIPGSQVYFAQGTERFVRPKFDAMYPANGKRPWYNPHLNTRPTNTMNYWICPANDNTALQQSTPVKLPNDPLGIVESIERDDSTELPAGGPMIMSSENSLIQCPSSPAQCVYTYYQDPANLPAQTQFRLGHLDRVRSWEKGRLARF